MILYSLLYPIQQLQDPVGGVWRTTRNALLGDGPSIVYIEGMIPCFKNKSIAGYLQYLPEQIAFKSLHVNYWLRNIQ